MHGDSQYGVHAAYMADSPPYQVHGQEKALGRGGSVSYVVPAGELALDECGLHAEARRRQEEQRHDARDGRSPWSGCCGAGENMVQQSDEA
ncbi:hypothetical protein CMQ_7100 [Grosmannia clavigera kw1407]|uniref:Uncharacterized protein n=1 Tax=Grosmannia clavigera (strain kw1407 / UAMH 11150) TaxID=655863 RepID=F0XPZ7_GROCL|nr:uncharacterized protein CMQ_7100 [Grosmannia clavigera kw1407]EFX00098.1 hypothetical protein CMQ_7100 [Grosmannia clavigera kw1407]